MCCAAALRIISICMSPECVPEISPNLPKVEKKCEWRARTSPWKRSIDHDETTRS